MAIHCNNDYVHQRQCQQHKCGPLAIKRSFPCHSKHRFKMQRLCKKKACKGPWNTSFIQKYFLQGAQNITQMRVMLRVSYTTNGHQQSSHFLKLLLTYTHLLYGGKKKSTLQNMQNCTSTHTFRVNPFDYLNALNAHKTVVSVHQALTTEKHEYTLCRASEHVPFHDSNEINNYICACKVTQ